MRIFILHVFVFLTACSAGIKTYPDNGQLARINTDQDQKLCKDAGGQPVTYTRFSFVCKWPATDAGKACSDSSECQGICDLPASAYKESVEKKDAEFSPVVIPGPRIKMVPRDGEEMSGICSREKAAYGKDFNCKSYVQNGRVASSGCAD